MLPDICGNQSALALSSLVVAAAVVIAVVVFYYYYFFKQALSTTLKSKKKIHIQEKEKDKYFLNKIFKKCTT